MLRKETLYSGAAGRLSFEDDSPEFSVDSIAWTASLTSLVTAVCLLQLVDKGLIKLDDDAREHVPWLKEAKILTDANAANGLILEDNTAAITLKYVSYVTGHSSSPSKRLCISILIDLTDSCSPTQLDLITTRVTSGKKTARVMVSTIIAHLLSSVRGQAGCTGHPTTGQANC